VVNEPGAGVVRICGRDILDNHAVNLVSVVVTALAVPYIALDAWPAGTQMPAW
jgi:hypothetical protein